MWSQIVAHYLTGKQQQNKTEQKSIFHPSSVKKMQHDPVMNWFRFKSYWLKYGAFKIFFLLVISCLNTENFHLKESFLKVYE